MMQLVCNGVALDLYEDAGLQFKKSNPSFAFGEMSAERTTQFKLPSTPTNDRAFALARIPAYDGEGMRRKYPVQLQAGTIVKNGFLYISEYDGKDYTAIMVAGLAYDIKAFGAKEWGDLLITDTYNTQTLYAANAVNIPLVAKVKFRSDAPAEEYDWQDYFRYQPSIDIVALLAKINDEGVMPITGLTSDKVRLIRNERTGEVDIRSTMTNNAGTLGTDGNGGMIEVGETTIYYEDRPPYPSITAPCFVFPTGGGLLTFPAGTPANLCACYAQEETQGMYSVDFVGSRRFNANGYYGEPLAGKTIEVRDGLMLIDMSVADFPYGQDNARFKADGDFSNVPAYNLQVRILGTISSVTPHTMISDLSLGELLKIYSVCTGKLLNVHADGSVEFIDALSPSYKTLALMEEKNVARTFSNYAQKNAVEWKDTDNVQEGERMRAYYIIDNDNIEEEKTLLTLKQSEGGVYEGTTDVLYVRGMKAERYEGLHVWKYYLHEEVVARCADEDQEYLQRVAMPQSTLLQGLCDASTQLKVKARMTMMEYEPLDSSVGFLVKGSLYTWTEATWQNDVCSLTLQRM